MTMVCLRGIRRRTGELLGVIGMFYGLFRGGSFTDVYIFQNSLNCTLKIMITVHIKFTSGMTE